MIVLFIIIAIIRTKDEVLAAKAAVLNRRNKAAPQQVADILVSNNLIEKENVQQFVQLVDGDVQSRCVHRETFGHALWICMLLLSAVGGIVAAIY